MNRSEQQPVASPWLRLSIRTLLLSMLSGSLLLALFTQGAASPLTGHTILVIGFAIPGGSWGYDITGTSRGTMIGLVTTAITGVFALSAAVLADAFFG